MYVSEVFLKKNMSYCIILFLGYCSWNSIDNAKFLNSATDFEKNKYDDKYGFERAKELCTSLVQNGGQCEGITRLPGDKLYSLGVEIDENANVGGVSLLKSASSTCHYQG